MKIAVFYYTQSGQARKVAEEICSTIIDTTVTYKQIIPLHEYPFPWSRNEFFDVFPESRLGLPPSGIHHIDTSDVEDVDLVLIVGQSWFLSPSLPLQSFFADSEVQHYLCGRKVLFVNVCRNMWLMTFLKVREYLCQAGALLVGHIVVQDKNPNLVSVVTIIRWMMYGKKSSTRLLPAAGVAEADIKATSKFGVVIEKALRDGLYIGLQQRLIECGAIHYKPSIVFLEKIGHRMFGLWAKFVRKKGEFGEKCRRGRLNVFFFYLLIVLFLLSPFGQLFFFLTYPLRNIKNSRKKDCGL